MTGEKTKRGEEIIYQWDLPYDIWKDYIQRRQDTAESYRVIRTKNDCHIEKIENGGAWRGSYGSHRALIRHLVDRVGELEASVEEYIKELTVDACTKSIKGGREHRKKPPAGMKVNPIGVDDHNQNIEDGGCATGKPKDKDIPKAHKLTVEECILAWMIDPDSIIHDAYSIPEDIDCERIDDLDDRHPEKDKYITIMLAYQKMRGMSTFWGRMYRKEQQAARERRGKRVIVKLLTE